MSTDRPRKKKALDREARVTSYGFGGFLTLLGAGLLVGFSFMERGPSKLFHLLAAGGVAALLSGIGLFLHPLDDEQLHAFRNDGNPIAVFGIMPLFWKAWMLLILAAMIGAVVFVSQNTVR